MEKIKVTALALVLGLATLTVAAAPAGASGKAVTVEGRGSGTVRLNTATGAFTGEESGVSSHLGKYRVHLEGTATTSRDGTVTGSGTVTIVAANGDRLTGTFTLTGRDGTQTVVVTISGGTGRFANATGTLTVICHSGPPTQQGETIVFEHECTMHGRLA